MAALVVGSAACKRSLSPEEAARIHQQRLKDSTDSADSVFRLQTADMLQADKEVEQRADSLRHLAELARKAQNAENKAKAEWLGTVFRSYVSGLNSQASGIQLGNATAQVAGRVAQLTAQAARQAQRAKADTAGVCYTFDRSVPQGDDWFIVTWSAGRQRISQQLHLVKASPGYQIDQIK